MALIDGRYDLNNIIITGGTGILYQATDTKTGNTVAVKHMPQPVAAQFNLSQQLSHNYIVWVDSALVVKEESYLIMPFISDYTLRHSLAKRPKPQINLLLQLALDLMDAVTHAHQNDTVYGLLCPENILIVADDKPRLLDFGLIGLGDFSASAVYMSPELCRGESYDSPTDIWSLGMIMYEALAGHHPFIGRTLEATTQNITQNLLPDLLGYRPEIPPTLADSIKQMLAKDPDKRLSDLVELKMQLEDLLNTAKIMEQSKIANNTPAESTEVLARPQKWHDPDDMREVTSTWRITGEPLEFEPIAAPQPQKPSLPDPGEVKAKPMPVMPPPQEKARGDASEPASIHQPKRPPMWIIIAIILTLLAAVIVTWMINNDSAELEPESNRGIIIYLARSLENKQAQEGESGQ